MKNIKFANLGIIALATALNGCSAYKYPYEINYELADNQKNASIELAESFRTFVYNVKEPIDIVLKAPEDHKIIIKDKEYASYKIKVNPQESINKGFYIKENGEKKPVYVETHIETFKEKFNPSNRTPIKKLSGKVNKIVGDNVFYSLNNNPKEVIVDLHEHNKRENHYFYYINGSQDVKVRMIAPKYTSFVFENGIKQKEYTFTLSKGDEYHFSMNLSQDNVDNTYSRTYKFNRK